MAKKSAPKNSVDKSVHVHQREKLKVELSIRERTDLTQKQIEILKTALEKDTRCIMIDGLYGSGKSWLAVLASLKLLNQKKVDQIIYIRNPVESSSTGKMGYLKGDMEEKLAPYASIVYDKLEELLPVPQIEQLKAENRVEAVPLGFTRGKSWNCKAIIVDEASSLTYEDFILLMTRCGEFTRIFFIGDAQHQSDIGNKTGFRKMFDKFNDDISRENGVFCFELKEKTDIVRSGFVRFILEHLEIIK
jgi:phosphate starvation-inducible PhoH-like protein